MDRLDWYTDEDVKLTVPIQRKVDAKKIKTLEDVILILSTMHLHASSTPDGFEAIEHLLEDKQ